MLFKPVLCLAAACLAAAQAPMPPAATPTNIANNSREFRLRTVLKYAEPNKARFANLWLASWTLTKNFPIEREALFNPDKDQFGITGFINYTDGEVGQLAFDLGERTPYTMDPINNRDYAVWSPMMINSGNRGHHGFYIDEFGLRWNSDFTEGTNSQNAYSHDWMVCEWWREKRPQLFWRNSMFDGVSPLCNCADIYLIPEYI